MLDINYIKKNPDHVKEFSKQKGYEVDVDGVLAADIKRREIMSELELLREERNNLANEAKKTNGKPSEKNVTRGKEIKEQISILEKDLNTTDRVFTDLLKTIPNIPWNDVPIGTSEDENEVVETIGKVTEFNSPEFPSDFKPRNHFEIGLERGWIDKERAAKVAGARFAYLKGDLVKLEMAIIQFTIETLTSESKIQEIIQKANLSGKVSDKPFVPILPPLMIKTDLYDAMDRLQPSEDRYKIEGQELWLQGSAEHVLGSMYADEIIDEKELPVRMLGFATSFRQEAGTYGKDMEGIFRVHQFDKLEMESFTTEENSFNEHLLFVAIQKYMLEQLNLPYRVLLKCTFDIGKPNARGVDMEVWLPGQGKYRETHTADYMTDYQSRRLKTRVRRDNGTVELIHTNDATAFALGRTIIAILENYQTSNSHIRVPDILQKYLSGREVL